MTSASDLRIQKSQNKSNESRRNKILKFRAKLKIQNKVQWKDFSKPKKLFKKTIP